jgi:hypothetical protein
MNSPRIWKIEAKAAPFWGKTKLESASFRVDRPARRQPAGAFPQSCPQEQRQLRAVYSAKSNAFLLRRFCHDGHRSATFGCSRRNGERPKAEKQQGAAHDSFTESQLLRGRFRMARFTFNLSQTVRYNVYVDAPTRMDALRKLVCDLQEPDGEPIDLYEIANDGLTIDAGQMGLGVNDDGLRRRRADLPIQREYDAGARKEGRRRS